MLESKPILIYLDTNVYARPFDDQTQPTIQEEANAFRHHSGQGAKAEIVKLRHSGF